MHAPDPDDVALARQWLEAIGRPDISDRMAAIYAMIGDQVEARSPACVASGRCCNFESYGHRLYVTGLEAAWCIVRLDGTTPLLSIQTVQDARQRGGCPFQTGTLCGVHTIKPVGCRTYFCDPTAQRWQEELTERAHEMVKAIHRAASVPYRYMEWRALLELFSVAMPDSAATRG